MQKRDVHKDLTIRILTLMIIAFMLGGCAVTIKTPGNRFESPEALGGDSLRFNVGASWLEVNEVSLTDDYTYTAPNATNPTIRRDRVLYVDLGLGFLKRFEISIKHLNMLQVKYQLLGDTQTEAKEGNFSLALSLGGGSSNESRSGTTVTNSSDRREITLKDAYGDLGSIVGYRAAETVLLYGGFFARRDSFDGTYTVVTTGAQTNYSGKISTNGFNFGLEFPQASSPIKAKLEMAHTKTKAGESEKKFWHSGVALRWIF